MINLIPNQEKKSKVKDFYFRLIVVFFMILGFSSIIVSVSMMPAYFLSSINKNLAITKLELQKSEPAPTTDSNFSIIIKDLSNKLNLIENAEKNKYLVSQKIINKILVLKMADIKINGINYEDMVGKGKMISIRGFAPSRERLLLFRRALEGDASFKDIDLPISNFVKGSNIEFYLTLTSS